jgi:4,5-DOPA dioxygenase extradiol
MPLFSHPLKVYILCFAALFVSLCIPFIHCRPQWPFTRSAPQAANPMSESSHPRSPTRTPAYFLSIGGPNFIGDTKHPAYAKLAAVGREITTEVKPKAVVVFSAHWQDGPNKIKINVAEKTDLIYDFYGFPSHYYEYDYPNKGSPEVAERVIEKLSVAGIEVERVRRGLDHGIWAGFLAGV